MRPACDLFICFKAASALHDLAPFTRQGVSAALHAAYSGRLGRFSVGLCQLSHPRSRVLQHQLGMSYFCYVLCEVPVFWHTRKVETSFQSRACLGVFVLLETFFSVMLTSVSATRADLKNDGIWVRKDMTPAGSPAAKGCSLWTTLLHAEKEPLNSNWVNVRVMFISNCCHAECWFSWLRQ